MIKEEFSLKDLNTFKVECICKRYFEFNDDHEIDYFCKNSLSPSEKIFILGGGSNTLLPINFPGTIIHPRNEEVNKISESSSSIIIKAGAGLEWDKLVELSVSNKWIGLENLSLIPGSVGASPVQNIGAYGSEASQFIHKVHCYNLDTKEFLTLTNHECNFSYRESIFKSRPELIVLHVEYTLQKPTKIPLKSRAGQYLKALDLMFSCIKIGPKTSWKIKTNFSRIRDLLEINAIPAKIKRKIVKAIRTKTMPNPDLIGNAGCFFKSPITTIEQSKKIKEIDNSISFYNEKSGKIKVSAGDLIKSCNWNGKRIDNVSLDRNRPLVVLNHGEATAKEILEFSKKVADDVYKKFKISIEPEVVIIKENQ